MKGNPGRFAFALLELLLVLAVLAVLGGFYFSRGSVSRPTRSSYEHTVDRSTGAACAANRTAMRSSLEIFRMNNPRAPLTTESLRMSGIILPRCPEGGSYTIAPDGSLICPNHNGQAAR